MIEDTLKERGRRYGDFTDHAGMAQDLLLVAMSDRHQRQVFWNDLDAVKRHAITYILDKVARVMTGDPGYVDNWHDIQGYAKLAEDRCENDAEGDATEGRVFYQGDITSGAPEYPTEYSCDFVKPFSRVCLKPEEHAKQLNLCKGVCSLCVEDVQEIRRRLKVHIGLSDAID